MTSFFIDPTDVLLFRDGRSFSASTEDNLAVGHFPPRPTSIYGALRSAILSNADANFGVSDFGIADTPAATVAGTQTEVGALTLQSFTLARRTSNGIERLFPVPFDILRRKADAESPYSEAHFTYLTPREDPPGATNMPKGLPLLWPKAQHGEEATVYTNASGYLPESAFRKVMEGEINHMESGVSLDTLYTVEPRTSVALDPETRTGREGQLFTVSFTRTDDNVGFVASVSDDEAMLGSAGWLRLGGEARSARYTTIDLNNVHSGAEQLTEKIKSNKGRFKLALTTPAVFSKGWLPDEINESLEGEIAGCSVHLRGAAVGSHEHLGGWDIAAGRPKTTRRAVPAGSVYFFEMENPEEADSLVSAAPTLSLGADAALRKQGLGSAQLGTYLI